MFSYRVTIAGVTKAAPSNGFIDHKRVEQYMPASIPSSYDNSVAKERANRRFEKITECILDMGSFSVTNMTATGADSNTQASSFSFTVSYSGSYTVLRHRLPASPQLVFHGVDALKRVIAEALMFSLFGVYGEIFDPTKPGNQTSEASRFGIRLTDINVGALATSIAEAESLITITDITPYDLQNQKLYYQSNNRTVNTTTPANTTLGSFYVE